MPFISPSIFDVNGMTATVTISKDPCDQPTVCCLTLYISTAQDEYPQQMEIYFGKGSRGSISEADCSTAHRVASAINSVSEMEP